MKLTIRLLLFVGALSICASVGRAQQPKALFYMTREPKSVRSFLAHADKIDLLVPAWYGVDANRTAYPAGRIRWCWRRRSSITFP